jgi:hypothetical protein
VERSWGKPWSGRILAIAVFKQRGRWWIRLYGIRNHPNARWHVAWVLSHITSWVLAYFTIRSHFAGVLAYLAIPRCRYRSYFANVLSHLATVLADITSILSSISCIFPYFAKLLAGLSSLRGRRRQSRWTPVLACLAGILAHESNGWHDFSQIQSRQSSIQSYQS